MPAAEAPSKLAAYTGKLRALQGALRGRASFYREREEEYRGICAEIVRSQAMLMKPGAEGDHEWSYGIELVAQFVASRLFSGGGRTGMRLFVSGQRDAVQQEPEMDHTRIKYRTVKQWVRAGRNHTLSGNWFGHRPPAPDGKEFREFDYHRSDSDIAFTVWREIQRGTAHDTLTGERGVLNFIANRTAARLEPMLAGVLAAWREAMAARYPPDFRAWMQAALRRTMAAGK